MESSDEIVRKLKGRPPAPPTWLAAGDVTVPGGTFVYVEAESGEGMRAYAEVWSERLGAIDRGRWAIRCDEPPEESAPTPLHYFAVGAVL